MPGHSPTKAVLAARVWRAMFDLLMRSAPERTRTLGRHGLTPNDARAMASLDAREGRTMRTLAASWECDASNVTWMVDRLEKLGLAERRSIPDDRRVRHIVLTPKGQQLQTALMEEFHAAPQELTMLDRDDLETLARILSRLPSPGAGPERTAEREPAAIAKEKGLAKQTTRRPGRAGRKKTGL